MWITCGAISFPKKRGPDVIVRRLRCPKVTGLVALFPIGRQPPVASRQRLTGSGGGGLCTAADPPRTFSTSFQNTLGYQRSCQRRLFPDFHPPV
jgi:hypothetical protein